MGFSPRTSQAMLGHVLGGQPMTAPSALYVGLHAGDPEDGGPEISGTRAPVQFASKAGTFQSTNQIDFPNLSPGPVTHYGVYDSPTQGNRLFSEAFTGVPRSMVGGETASIPPGGLTVI